MVTASWPATPEPPIPFEPRSGILDAGTILQRIRSNRFRPNQFNPGPKGAGRFHFFGDPAAPALYLAETRESALAETLLHDVPVGAPAPLPRSIYANSVLAGLELKQPIRVAEFFGLGLRALGVEATQLTDTPMDNYTQTRKWAHAAHAAGFDGIGWMSKRDNSASSTRRGRSGGAAHDGTQRRQADDDVITRQPQGQRSPGLELLKSAALPE